MPIYFTVTPISVRVLPILFLNIYSLFVSFLYSIQFIYFLFLEPLYHLSSILSALRSLNSPVFFIRVYFSYSMHSLFPLFPQISCPRCSSRQIFPHFLRAFFILFLLKTLLLLLVINKVFPNSRRFSSIDFHTINYYTCIRTEHLYSFYINLYTFIYSFLSFSFFLKISCPRCSSRQAFFLYAFSYSPRYLLLFLLI